MTDDTERLVDLARTAHESVRMLNHGTIIGSTPAPLVYDLTANLSAMAYALDQLAGQLSRGLLRSLETHDVYDGKGEPSEQAQLAAAYLDQAQQLSQQLARHLSNAQAAISEQGHRGPRATVAAEPAEVVIGRRVEARCPMCGAELEYLATSDTDATPAELARLCELANGDHLALPND
jgi:hypothetical protein